jgi:hypothetical protein
VSTRFFTNCDDNTLFRKLKAIAEHNPDLQQFDALVGYLRASGYFALRPFLDAIPQIRVLVGINVDALMAEYHKRGMLFLTDPSKTVADFARSLRQDTRKSIRAPFIDIQREVTVIVPTIEGLLGDKLTAFAPRTLGVPFEPAEGKPCDTMQVVKQMFDVAALFDATHDLPAIDRAYAGMWALENGYRGNAHSREQTLNDTRNACLALSMHGFKGVAAHPDAALLRNGVDRLTNHLIRTRFNQDDAKTAAGKVALLTTLLLHGDMGLDLASMRFDPQRIEELRAPRIGGAWQSLNGLRQGNPEAFSYWHHASRIAGMEDGAR